MIPTKTAAMDFLDQRLIAIAGVSRTPGGAHSGNIVYKRLRERGYEVFGINPSAEEIEGDPAYENLAAIPGGVDAVVIATTPEVADQVMQGCIDENVTRVWMHRSIGSGSVSATAAALGPVAVPEGPTLANVPGAESSARPSQPAPVVLATLEPTPVVFSTPPRVPRVPTDCVRDKPEASVSSFTSSRSTS